MPMKTPPHPGRSIRNACLEPLGLSVTDGAKLLGITRQALNNVINGKSGISPEMAIRLTKAFGSTPETWLQMQLAYDIRSQHRKQMTSHKAMQVIYPIVVTSRRSQKLVYTNQNAKSVALCSQV